jgi:hypothetical protein
MKGGRQQRIYVASIMTEVYTDSHTLCVLVHWCMLIILTFCKIVKSGIHFIMAGILE